MGKAALKNEIFDRETLDELNRCSACGTCHSVCPVYNLTGDDSLSARGRIHILKAIAEGEIGAGKVGREIFDRCLLCYACESACPSGVNTSKIWIKAREYFSRSIGSGIKGGALRVISKDKTLPRLMAVGQMAQRIIPGIHSREGVFRPKLADRFLLDELPNVVPAKGEKKYRVGYFVGCVSNFFLGEIGIAAIEVLSALGCEVVIPKGQVCCGAPAFNNGEMEAARRLARRNVEAFLEAEVDYIVSADATCGGSFAHEYKQIIGSDDLYEEFAGKYREIHGLILELGLEGKLKPVPAKVTYHDSCHLRHTQKVWRAPRKILKSLPGVEFREMADADLCCGFGGSFSLFHGGDSTRISEDKLENAIACGAEEIAAGSPGCILKLREEAAVKNLPVKVKHTLQFVQERMNRVSH